MLTKLSETELRSAIIEHRAAVRNHRDQKGDDRCWIDDYVIWAMLDDSADDLKTPPPFDEAMRLCRDYWIHRNAKAADPKPADALEDSSQWDNDLARMSISQLLDALTSLQNALRTHRDITGRPRTAEDDRLLYALLPEKIPADFRLPAEDAFLGEARAPKAGCPSFWRSHQNCAENCHNLHTWGPCHCVEA